MQDFFDNTIGVQARASVISQLLLNSAALVQWDPEIRSVSALNSDGEFELFRGHSAINRSEKLTISANDTAINYRVKGDRLSYQVQFQLTAKGEMTVVNESVMVETSPKLNVPLTLLRPIAQHAFMTNLRGLANLAERWSDSEAPQWSSNDKKSKRFLVACFFKLIKFFNLSLCGLVSDEFVVRGVGTVNHALRAHFDDVVSDGLDKLTIVTGEDQRAGKGDEGIV